MLTVIKNNFVKKKKKSGSFFPPNFYRINRDIFDDVKTDS